MKKTLLNLSSLLVVSLWCGNLVAGSLVVPNTFVAGTTASASEVNANFNAIKTAVDDNDSRITSNISDIGANAANIAANTNAINTIGGIGVLVDGVRIGSFLNFYRVNYAGFNVLLPTGYIARLKLDATDIVESPFTEFDGADCTGASFIRSTDVDPIVPTGLGQVVRTSDGDPESYRYILPGSGTSIKTRRSYYASGGCINSTGTSQTVYVTHPNDSNVTGITGTTFVGTVTLGQ